MAEGPTYIDGGVSVYGGAHFDRPSIFVHGETAQFHGWTDSHRDGKYGIADTSNATFTIDIIGPTKENVYHTVLKTDESGNAYFSVPITDSFPFGSYAISYSLEKEGFIGISPDVGYRERAFFVTWFGDDDVIDSSGKHKLELFYADDGDNINGNNDIRTVKFGSSIDLKGRLCPSPINPFDDARTIGSVLEGPGSVQIITQFGPVVDNNSSISDTQDESGSFTTAAHSVSIILSGEDICSSPFDISLGGFFVTGYWSIKTDAYWIQSNDTTHVYHTSSTADDSVLTFEVAQTQYRSSNIIPVRLDSARYPGATPMDWSPDSESILFRYSYHSASPTNERQKLGILDLTNNGNVTELDPLSKISGVANRTVEGGGNDDEDDDIPVIDDARFLPSGDTIVILSGSNIYSFNISNESLQTLVAGNDDNSEPIGFFDVNPDGSLIYNMNGTLMIADIGGKDPIAIPRPDDPSYWGHYGDLSPDGKKLLYRKVLDAGYGWSYGVLAYYDVETKEETVIPNITNGCGHPPKWGPDGFHLVYHEESCFGRGWPGATLKITDINGSFEEFIVPASNDYPDRFIFSPDGSSMIIGFRSSEATPEGAAENMGGPADFYIMTLATPMPEFGSSIIISILLSTLIGAIILAARFNLHRGLK